MHASGALLVLCGCWCWCPGLACWCAYSRSRAEAVLNLSGCRRRCRALYRRSRSGTLTSNRRSPLQPGARAGARGAGREHPAGARGAGSELPAAGSRQVQARRAQRGLQLSARVRCCCMRRPITAACCGHWEAEVDKECASSLRSQVEDLIVLRVRAGGQHRLALWTEEQVVTCQPRPALPARPLTCPLLLSLLLALLLLCCRRLCVMLRAGAGAETACSCWQSCWSCCHAAAAATSGA